MEEKDKGGRDHFGNYKHPVKMELLKEYLAYRTGSQRSRDPKEFSETLKTFKLTTEKHLPLRKFDSNLWRQQSQMTYKDKLGKKKFSQHKGDAG